MHNNSSICTINHTLGIAIGNHTSVLYYHNKFKHLTKNDLRQHYWYKIKKNYNIKNNNNNNCPNKTKFNKCIIIPRIPRQQNFFMMS